MLSLEKPAGGWFNFYQHPNSRSSLTILLISKKQWYFLIRNSQVKAEQILNLDSCTEQLFSIGSGQLLYMLVHIPLNCIVIYSVTQPDIIQVVTSRLGCCSDCNTNFSNEMKLDKANLKLMFLAI